MEQAYRSNNELNNTTNYLKKTTNNGIKYTELDGKLFRNNDGTVKTPREAYKALVGQTLKLDDGTQVKIIDKLENIVQPKKPKKMYNELSKRLPRASGITDLSQIKDINNKINGNLDEAIETSDYIRTKPDVNQRHKEYNVKKFDTREVNIYDPDTQQAYTLELSIAELNNGEKVGYAKKLLKTNNTLKQTIKKETLTSSASKSGRHSRSYVSNNSILPTQENVNSDTQKYSMQEKEKNTQNNENSKQSSFSLPKDIENLVFNEEFYDQFKFSANKVKNIFDNYL